MSYYLKSKYNFSTHGLERCKERLKMKNEPEYKVKEKVYDLIKKSIHSFEDNGTIHIAAGNSDLYFVINKANNLIITCTKISVSKQMELFDNDEDY